MYAKSFGRRRFDPASLAIAAGASTALVAALIGSAPHVTAAIERTLSSYAVPLSPPPPPDPIPVRKTLSPRSSAAVPDAPRPLVEPPPRASDFAVTVIPIEPFVVGTGVGDGAADSAAVEPARPAPVIVAPDIDPRFADQLQPPYPSEEQRLGRQGKVGVRVLIGIDGRVRQVERMSATSDAFFRAVERQALTRWRFTPGTRDGVQVEAWRTMTLRFVLE